MDYTKASDEQLANIISYDMDCPTHLLSGVVTEMLNRNLLEGLVKKAILKRFRRIYIASSLLGIQEEDILQFCRMTLFEAVNKFQPGKSSFRFFAYLKMVSDLKDLEKKVKAESRKVYENIQSIDVERNENGDTYAEIFQSGQNVEREVIQKISLEEKMQPLTWIEQKSFLLYMKGYSSTEIAPFVNKSRETVSRQINSALSKMCGKRTTIKELGIVNVGKGEPA